MAESDIRDSLLQQGRDPFVGSRFVNVGKSDRRDYVCLLPFDRMDVLHNIKGTCKGDLQISESSVAVFCMSFEFRLNTPPTALFHAA